MTFETKFNGKLYGVLMWKQFDAHWAWLNDNPKGWFVWQNGEAAPSEPMSEHAFRNFLTETEIFLRKQDSAKQCGFMYIDAPSEPTLLKVFDPRRMGSACGCSGKVIMPRWTISSMKPQALN